MKTKDFIDSSSGVESSLKLLEDLLGNSSIESGGKDGIELSSPKQLIISDVFGLITFKTIAELLLRGSFLHFSTTACTGRSTDGKF